MNADQIVKWIEEHPLIDKTKLENACQPKLPKYILRKHINGHQKLSEKHVHALFKILCNYGLEESKH